MKKMWWLVQDEENDEWRVLRVRMMRGLMWTRDPMARSKTLRTVGNRGQSERTRIHFSRKMIASPFVRAFTETCETESRELDCSRTIVFALLMDFGDANYLSLHPHENSVSLEIIHPFEIFRMIGSERRTGHSVI
jgi:hypothetical protein